MVQVVDGREELGSVYGGAWRFENELRGFQMGGDTWSK
jgi:hypothetical protein